MLWKLPIKNPIFSLGILMMIIVFFDLARRGVIPSFYQQLIPSSCKSALVMLDKRLPKNWKTKCDRNNMSIIVHSQIKAAEKQDLPQILYRDLANKLQFVARNTPRENLERTLSVRLDINHPAMTIYAWTEGQNLAKLSTMTDPSLIAQHLKTTVKVQEKKF